MKREGAPWDVQVETLTREQREAISFATELLLKNENPNAHLLAACLRALEGHWTEARIQSTAELALVAAEDYLDEVDCSDCAASKNDISPSSTRYNLIRSGQGSLKEFLQ